MRLIDADKLMEELAGCFYDTTDPAARRAAHDTMALCQSLVEEQPTAYDVDNVVERLEDMQDITGWDLLTVQECKRIVKSGGIERRGKHENTSAIT